jgi:hypothetical protein
MEAMANYGDTEIVVSFLIVKCHCKGQALLVAGGTPPYCFVNQENTTKDF